MISRSVVANRHGREYDDKYYPIIKSFTVLDVPRPKRRGPRPYTLAWFRSYKPPLLLVYRLPFRLISYVFAEISQTSRSPVPHKGRNYSHPSYRTHLPIPRVDQNFHLVLPFPLAHQASRVGRRLRHPATCSRLWASRAPSRRHGCRYG